MTHIIKNEFLRVEAAEHGAELQSIRDADGAEYLWQGDPAYWQDRAPNLFPYVARLTDESYYLDSLPSWSATTWPLEVATLNSTPSRGLPVAESFLLMMREPFLEFFTITVWVSPPWPMTTLVLGASMT